MKLSELNTLSELKLKIELTKCCGSRVWVNQLSNAFPVSDEQILFTKAKRIWYEVCSRADWLEAFSHHPRIGELDALRQKFASTAEWAEGEQASVRSSSDEVLETLSRWNALYEEKFGYIFIVCATGKTAEEMLALLSVRLTSTSEEEIMVAMQEQSKITELRLKKLLAP